MITEFGTNPSVKSENKTDEIQKLLVGIYNDYLNLKPEFDDTDFAEEPNFDYNAIRKNVEANFPGFGFYGCIMDSTIIVPEKKDIGTGDAIDDLTDIIKDLLEVKWSFENTSIKNAEWHFYDLMKIHSEQHLVDLIKYIKDLKG